MLTVLGVLLLRTMPCRSSGTTGRCTPRWFWGSIAAAFGAIYAFGYGGRRWARIPAIFFATVAGVALFASLPWHWFVGWDFGLPLWPVLLIVLGAIGWCGAIAAGHKPPAAPMRDGRGVADQSISCRASLALDPRGSFQATVRVRSTAHTATWARDLRFNLLRMFATWRTAVPSAITKFFPRSAVGAAAHDQPDHFPLSLGQWAGYHRPLRPGRTRLVQWPGARA